MAQHRPQRLVGLIRYRPNVVEDTGAPDDLLVFLGVVPQAGVVADHDLAEVRLLDAGQNAQQRRRAGSVQPHDENARAPLGVNVDIEKHHVVPERLAETDTF